MSTRDKLLRLKKQLEKLEERHEKLVTQQALSFYRKAKRILKDAFSPELVLVILTHARDTAAAIQKQEEEETRALFNAENASDFESFNLEKEDDYGPF
jgi:hypothetical protein